MCTGIAEKIEISGGYGKGTKGWFDVNQVNVSYDHPYHAPLEHSLNLDFVNESHGLSARVAVELSVDAAKALVQKIEEVLAKADAGGHIVD